LVSDLRSAGDDLMEPRERIGLAIRERRIMAGLTLGELSARCGLPESRIGAIERGRWNPTLDTLLRLSEGLACELWEMLMPESLLTAPPSLARARALLLELDPDRLILAEQFLVWLVQRARAEAVVERLRPPSQRRLRALARFRRHQAGL
jgi:transcriptional regulator with XRE-family HTH domain